MEKIRMYSHRGLHTKNQSIMENSIESFKLSVKKGYGIELDVQLSLDQEVIVFHDKTLKRLFNNESELIKLTSKELTQTYSIPTLKSVLDLVNGEVPLIIELKVHHNNIRELCEKTMSVLSRYGGDFSVESFDPRVVRWFFKNHPSIKRGQLIMPLDEYDNKIIGYLISNLHFNYFCRPDFVAIRKDVATSPKVKQFYKKQTKELVGWTLHEGDEDWYDAMIFEYFNPAKKY